MSRHLHIVCFDVPWPADYGGAIDMMNRISAFNNNGIKIHLHYFLYNDRGTPFQLKNFCETVNAYNRKSFKESLSIDKPYIVSSRINQELIKNLSKDNYPILFEGLHTTGVISQLHLQERKVCIRMHNEESVYYRELVRHTHDPIKRTYYYIESLLIKKYSKSLPNSLHIAALSDEDSGRLQKIGFTNTVTIPAFTTWQQVNTPTGMGNFCFFHGNLSVPENDHAARWLLAKVFTKVRVPFVIAGKNPSKKLQKAASLCQHTCLVSNPTEDELTDLLKKAHINVLPLLNKNSTGIRLKLLHTLFEGRHCITTPAMVAGTGLDAACHVGHSSNALASIISQLYYQPFEEEEIHIRKYLLRTYNNQANIQKFIDCLW